MLTIRTLEKIKLGSRITLFNGIYATLLGIFYLGFFNFILKTNFKAIDTVWQVFAKYNPEVNSLFIRLMLLKGAFIIAIAVLLIYLSMSLYRKKEKQTWVALFIVGIIFWPSLLTFEILDKNLYTIIAVFLGWLSFIIGMLIPAKYFIKSEPGYE